MQIYIQVFYKKLQIAYVNILVPFVTLGYSFDKKLSRKKMNIVLIQICGSLWVIGPSYFDVECYYLANKCSSTKTQDRTIFSRTNSRVWGTNKIISK